MSKMAQIIFRKQMFFFSKIEAADFSKIVAADFFKEDKHLNSFVKKQLTYFLYRTEDLNCLRNYG